MSACHTCELLARRDAGTAPLWDSIVRYDDWDVVHANDTSLLGWIVLVCRRHIESIDELTESEAAHLGELLRSVSLFLKSELGCRKTYVMQFAEHPQHPHVHFHVVPRMGDLPDEHKGANIFHYLVVDDAERVTEDAMNALGGQLRSWLPAAG